jgi:hypothetical protein
MARDASALVDDQPHAGGFDGYVYTHDKNDNDDTAAISARFKTGAPPPMGADVRLRWLYARHYYDAQDSEYDVQVLQESSKITGTTEAILMGESERRPRIVCAGYVQAGRKSRQALYTDTDLDGLRQQHRTRCTPTMHSMSRSRSGGSICNTSRWDDTDGVKQWAWNNGNWIIYRYTGIQKA